MRITEATTTEAPFSTRSIDGEVSIYPGHPVTIAWVIMQVYPSLGDAMRRSELTGYPDALSNGAIPGAGGNVYAALDFLRKVTVEGASIDDTIAHANSIWSGCDGQATGGDFAKTAVDRERFLERWRSGQIQADKIVVDLSKRLEQWR